MAVPTTATTSTAAASSAASPTMTGPNTTTRTRRSKRNDAGIPCYEFFVNRSGAIDAATIRNMAPSMVMAHAVRAWKNLSPTEQADIIQSAKAEELAGKAPSAQIIGAVSEAAANVVSEQFGVSKQPSGTGMEPMIVVHTTDDGTVDDIIPSGDAADSNPAADSNNMEVEVILVDSEGNEATGNTADAGDTDLDAALADAKAKYEAADKEVKDLREQLKREKRKDEQAVKKAEAKRTKLHTAMRRIQMSVELRDSLKAHTNGDDAVPERKPAVGQLDNSKPALSVGQYVDVMSDYSPGMKRHHGKGFAVATRGVGGATLVDVEYLECYGGNTFTNITLDHLTADVFRFNEDSLAKGRAKRVVPAQERDTVAVERPKKKRDTRTPTQKLVDDLVDGYQRGLSKGWMRKKTDKSRGKPRLQLEEKMILFNQAMLLEEYIAARGGNKHSNTYAKSGKFKSRGTGWNPLTTKYLVMQAWGLSKNALSLLKKESRENAIAQGVAEEDAAVQIAFCPKAPMEEKERLKSVIDDLEAAKRHFTAARLYAIDKYRDVKQKSYDAIEKEESNEMIAMYLAEYETLDDDTKRFWDLERRNHLARQPYIKHEIVRSMSNNPQRSFRGLEVDIGYWCSHKCIERWLNSFDTFEFYRERICPLLSPAQKKKHLEFAKSVLDLWGLKDTDGNLPNGKKRILLIHYDEKWFWGLVLRAYAKSCEELGIEKKDYATFHRNHINKVMAIAFVGAVFTDTLENGCEVVKLPMVRAQAYKIAERAQYEAVRTADGRVTYPSKNPNGSDKKPLRKKGQPYPVDCCVTGSKEGTKKDPKCPLLLVFKHVIFPAIEERVSPGKEYDDCHVVIQGDQAGPHEDASFSRYVKEYCSKQGWTWAPQAPQMPHGNVLDLSVFPAMSRRHQESARKISGCKVLTRDQIWDEANKCWNEIPNCKIARAFVQYWRTMRKVIEVGGSNSFCGRGGNGLHAGISKDFDDTTNGVKPSPRHPSRN